MSFERIRGSSVDEQVFAMHVPASPDAPHLIYKDRARMLFACPFRDGTGTNWMAERQLESAYRQRFAVRADQLRDLRALYEEAAATFDSTVRATIVAIARPEQPRPALLGRLTRDQVRTVFDAAHTLSGSFITGGGTLSAFTDVDLLNPRPGLRRYSSRSVNEPVEFSRQAAVISLYDDGSIALIWSVGGFRAKAPFTVPSFMLERAAIDLTSLVGAAARALSIDSGWSVELGLLGPNIEILSQGWDRTWSVSTSIRQFQPVRLSIPPAADDATLLASARDVALDCVNQAGIASLGVIRADD